MADKNVFPKQQLEIVQVQEPKSYSSGTKFLLPVMAKNLSLAEGDPSRGKSWKYTVFNQALQDHIKPLEVGARFLCDIEERERPDSEYGPDRNIVQIYIDGKPVSTKTGGGGGGGWKGRSLEDDLALEQVKRRSIEGQTMTAQVGAIVLAVVQGASMEGVGIDVETFKRLEGKYWQVVEKGLDNYLAGPPKTQAAKTTREPASKPADKPQDKQGTAEKTEKVSKVTTPITDPIKHVGDLLTRAGKLKPPVARDELCVGLSINDPKEIKGLEAAWKTAQEISVSKAGKEGEKLFE